MQKIKEECGIFGVNLKTNEAVGIVYNGLLALQHRGQEGAGIACVCSEDNDIHVKKDLGLVKEVFSNKVIAEMPASNVAIGHVRYSTTGSNTKANVSPFLADYLTGRLAVAHNGNITNAKQLRAELKKLGLRFSATSDSEVVALLIAYYKTTERRTIDGVKKAASMLNGAFSLVIASGKNKLIAVRDPNGFRPLCLGKSKEGIAIASESCALESGGFEFLRDVAPGEIVVIEKGEIVSEGVKLKDKEQGKGLCIFEYVYFARPDSIIDGLSVYESRHNMGQILAKEHPVDADIVCGVPDSGMEAAIGYSAASGIPLAFGFVKNRYLGRSFIYPTQNERESVVKLKLNPLRANINGKKIVLVDDSIVRGTTIGKIIKSLKDAGAKEIHIRVSSPPFKYSCQYGTDIDSEENLIANRMTHDEICQKIGADSLGFISMEGLIEACKKCETEFCTACFTGNELKNKKNDLE
ncbi:MAG: amidophosphoribosyltransferase [Firmicutes bacterium]|nr:amidophosphoribosyltransferase [Bacillota bacterium]